MSGAIARSPHVPHPRRCTNIIAKIFEHRKANGMKPLGVVKAAALEDGSSLARYEIASGKARAAINFNMGTRALEKFAISKPHFIQGAMSAIPDGLVPMPGGVIIKDQSGTIIGSGDTADNDELAALAGITAAGFVGDGG